jgi:hypothetical protein
MLHCWLEVGPEDPAMGQLDQGSQLVPSVLEQMMRWYPNFTLHCVPEMQLSQLQHQKGYSTVTPSTVVSKLTPIHTR